MTRAVYKHPSTQGPTFDENIALGNIEGAKINAIVGYNDEIPTGVKEDIRSISEDLVYLNTAEFINIYSDNINDNVSGTGARVIFIEGLDENFKEISETVPLNGITPVLTLKKYIRINNLFVIQAGSSGKNEGLIIAEDNINTTIQSSIPIGINSSKQSNYTIPIDKKGILRSYVLSVGKGDEVELFFETRDAISNRPFIISTRIIAYESGILNSNINLPISGGTDIKVTGVPITNNPRISVTLGVILI